jgi:hypothetical protein
MHYLPICHRLLDIGDENEKGVKNWSTTDQKTPNLL